MQEKYLIFIPCYNESKRLNISDFSCFLDKNDDFHICFINDGSTDNTATVLKQFCINNNNASFFNLTKNVGKAEAIRTAILKTKINCTFLGYLDADLSTSLEEFKRLLLLKKVNTVFIFGSRLKKLGTSIQRSQLRHFFGRMLATIVNRFILKSNIYDTQCGAKWFKKEFAYLLFRSPFKSEWLFDIELFLRAKKQLNTLDFNTKIIEIPLIKWHDKGDSRISFSDFLNIPVDLFKIYNHYD